MDSTGLKQKAVSGTKWTAVSAVVVVLQMSLLAKILGPATLGLMTSISVVMGFAATFADVGVSSALIYRQDTTRNQLSSLYWLNIASSLIVFLVLYAASPLISSYYNNSVFIPAIALASFVIPITAIGQQFQFLLQKEMYFRQLSIFEMVATIAGFVVSVKAAFSGAGVYAIIWGQLASAAVKSLLLFIYGFKKWPLRFYFKKSDLKGYISFGFYQMGEKIINYFNSNLDYMLIGRLLGNEALGYYSLAYNIIAYPVTKINPIITRVAYPVFSKLQNSIEHLRNGYISVVRTLSFVNFPLLLGLAVVAPNFIPLYSGERYHESILLTQILCGVGLLRTVCNPIGSLMMSRGRADLGFKWNLVQMLVQIPALYFGVYHGRAAGVGLMYFIVMLIFSILMYFIPIRILVGDCFSEYFLSMWPSLWISAIMCVFVWAAGLMFGFMHAYAIIPQVIIGALVYTVAAYTFRRDTFNSLIGMALSKKVATTIKS